MEILGQFREAVLSTVVVQPTDNVFLSQFSASGGFVQGQLGDTIHYKSSSDSSHI
jgi:hypothetical protein